MYPIQEYNFATVELTKIQKVLQKNLTKYFESVEVKLSECPDLSLPPYNLATKGFGNGTTGIVDLGGVPYLIPLVDRTRVYDLPEIMTKVIGMKHFPKGCYISGAGAGPFPSQGSNCEMIINMRLEKDGKLVENKSRIALTSSGKDSDVEMRGMTTEGKCSLLANFMVTSGEPGKILEIKCSGRKVQEVNFTGAIRESLSEEFGEIPIGLGGLFTLSKSPTKVHIMRDFSTTPLQTDEDVNEWLKFFAMDPPMLFQSVLHSHDIGYDLRIEHAHGWSLAKNEGGHYHYDLNPENVEYHGIYGVAQKLWRIDRPEVTHTIGRD